MRNFILILAISISSAISLQAQTNTAYYYHNLPYGSESVFNPLSVLLNRGFDVLQVRRNQRDIWNLDYEEDFLHIIHSLSHPARYIEEYGWSQFAKRELFPLDFSKYGARWAPNYTLHLIGGGYTYMALYEWFNANNVKFPALWSASTVLVSALINETIENKSVTRGNTDAIADFYFFDIGGILLFSLPSVNRFFSKYLHLRDWSFQPAFTYPDLSLHNHGQYFSIKINLPLKNLSLFGYTGMGAMGGITYHVDKENDISVGFGAKSSRFVDADDGQHLHAVQFAKCGGFFWDRNGSLLTSLVINDIQDYFINFNIYPGISKRTKNLGMWAVFSRKGVFTAGIIFRRQISFGVGI